MNRARLMSLGAVAIYIAFMLFGISLIEPCGQHPGPGVETCREGAWE